MNRKLFLDDGPTSTEQIFAIYALIFSRVCPSGGDLLDYTDEIFWHFAGPWEETKTMLNSSLVFNPSSPDFDVIVESELQYHIRIHAVIEHAQDKTNPSGLIVRRLKGHFPSGEGLVSTSFQERRCSLLCYVAGQRHKPEVTPEVKIVILGDMKSLDPFNFEEMTQLRSPGWLKGYYLFQCFIWMVHQRWAEDWHACLDQIDQCVSFKVCY